MISEPFKVGARIRLLRERKGFTLRALAERCGLSVNAISQIERGENSPTVSSLHLLAGALEVPITDFFRDDDERAAVFVTSADRQGTETAGVRMESLGIGLPYQQLQPFLVTVEPGSGNVDQPVAHSGEEFVFCLSGTMDYLVAGEAYQLRPGDSLLLDSAQLHAFQNRSATPASCLLVFLTRGDRHLARRLHIESIHDNGQ